MMVIFVVAILALLILLWLLLRVFTLWTIMGKLRHVKGRELLQSLMAILKASADRRLFVKFMATEVGLAGGIQLVGVWVTARYKDVEGSLMFQISDNAEWLAIVVAILIAVGYYLYLRGNVRKNDRELAEIAESARLIDREYTFNPTAGWFAVQNKDGIKLLGNRYSEERNFPFKDIDYLMGCFDIDDTFWPLLEKKISELQSKANSLIKHEFKGKNEDDKKEWKLLIKATQKILPLITSLDGSISSYRSLKNGVDEYEDVVSNHIWSLMYKYDRPFEYLCRELREAVAQLQTEMNIEWLWHKEQKTLFITGTAGMGKSHLIGDIVNRRMRKGQPSLLFLGQHFTAATDPLSQMRDRLDVKCRKEVLLEQLNKYGEKINENVVIFVDGINEGAGDALWSRFLDDLILNVEKYSHLRLVISFRTSDMKNWFHDLAEKNRGATYIHKGFTDNQQEACEYMFSAFGLEQPLWPVYGDEFANPLFIIKYCREHERSGEPLIFEDFWTIISKYCKSTNHELAKRFGYNDSIDLVTLSMKTIAQLQAEAGNRLNLLFDDALQQLTDVAKYTKNPEGFMDLLIDEGLLMTDPYQGKVYVNYGFERIGDYFIADYVVDHVDASEWFKYKWGDIGEALTVICPVKKVAEAFELVPKEEKNLAFSAFLQNSEWRDEFTDKGKDVLQKLKDNGYIKEYINVVLKRPFREDRVANSSALYELLENMTMAERDAKWSVLISEEWEAGRPLMALATWGKDALTASLERIDDKTAMLCAEALIWSFTTTWRGLRDTATHALVNIMKTHTGIILDLLTKYYHVNDSYLTERLWAAAFGGLLCSQDRKAAGEVAEWAYKNTFGVDDIPENILTRDYIKEIIRYAQSLNVCCAVDEQKLRLPYGNGEIPDDIPSSDDIKARFSRDWQTIPEEEKNEYRATSKILDSMATEHSPRTMYGDFGRYVFQSNLSSFEDVDSEHMSNWAIQMIFDEYGYDAKTFEAFDIRHASKDRSHSNVERVGKKYQWIAMWRIMAILSDCYADDKSTDDWATPVGRARSIDPTVIPGENRVPLRSRYEVPEYDVISERNDRKWLKAWKKMPPIEEYLITSDSDGVDWVNLYAYNTIKGRPNDKRTNGLLDRDLWTFVQSFLVKKEHLGKVCVSIDKNGLYGRSFHENREIETLFYREFFWSDEYRTLMGMMASYQEVDYLSKDEESGDVKIYPTYMEYQLSSYSDASAEQGVNILLPNECLYFGMGLRFAKENGAWSDEDGNLVVLDNAIYGNGHQALLVRKDRLMSYLNRNDLVIFWPILTERMIKATGSYANHIQCGGWAYMDEEGCIHHKFRCYEATWTEKKVAIWKGKINEQKKRLLYKIYDKWPRMLPKRTKEELLFGHQLPNIDISVIGTDRDEFKKLLANYDEDDISEDNKGETSV